MIQVARSSFNHIDKDDATAPSAELGDRISAGEYGRKRPPRGFSPSDPARGIHIWQCTSLVPPSIRGPIAPASKRTIWRPPRKPRSDPVHQPNVSRCQRLRRIMRQAGFNRMCERYLSPNRDQPRAGHRIAKTRNIPRPKDSIARDVAAGEPTPDRRGHGQHRKATPRQRGRVTE